MRHLFTTSVCLALLVLALALLCIGAPAAAPPAGDTYPFVRDATYPNGTPWQIEQVSFGIAINKTGYTFITQYYVAPHIRVFDPAGNEVARWNGPGGGSGFCGIAADSQYIYVADHDLSKLRVYTLSGDLVRNVTTASSPFGVSVNSTGYVFVTCRGSNSVMVIPPGGDTATTFVSGLTEPWAFAVNTTDYLYVAQRDAGPIDIFDRDGTAAAQPIRPSTSYAEGIAFDASDRVFFTQSLSSGLFRGYSPSGAYLGTSQAGYLTNPSGIAVTTSG